MVIIDPTERGAIQVGKEGAIGTLIEAASICGYSGDALARTRDSLSRGAATNTPTVLPAPYTTIINAVTITPRPLKTAFISTKLQA
jgi:hypothetical protein